MSGNVSFITGDFPVSSYDCYLRESVQPIRFSALPSLRNSCVDAGRRYAFNFPPHRLANDSEGKRNVSNTYLELDVGLPIAYRSMILQGPIVDGGGSVVRSKHWCVSPPSSLGAGIDSTPPLGLVNL